MVKNKPSKTYSTLAHWLDFRFKLCLEGIAIGLLAGLLVVLYRLTLEKAENLRINIYTILETSNYTWPIIGWFIGLIGIAYILGIIIQEEPMAGGSGIPQVKGVLQRQLKMRWLRVIAGKFFGGVLAIGSGLSLGREGPSIQLGAAVGQGLGRLLGRMKIEEKYLITSGASAGLAAAFNAPLAGVIFALEELHKNFSPLVLTSAMAASLTADLVTQQFFGQKPIFNLPSLNVLPLRYYLYLIGLGLIIGVFGVIFNWSLTKTLDVYARQTWLRPRFKPVFALILAGLLGFILPETLGGGHNLINSISTGHFPLYFLFTLVLVKFLFTMVSYGSGVPGGIFLPMLVIGALAGDIYGQLIVQFFHVNPQYTNNFIILAMAAYFTAVVKAPITASILITEMTGSFHHLLALTTVAMTAYLVTDLLRSKPVYEILLERILKNKGLEKFRGNNKTKALTEIAVCLGSKLDGKRVKDIEWPSCCLIVGIKRGETEIIPQGNTTIYVGDCIIALSNEDQIAEAERKLLSMACDGSYTKLNN